MQVYSNIISQNFNSFFNRLPQPAAVFGIDVVSRPKSSRIHSLNKIKHHTAMASFCEIFQLDDVLEAPGGDGIGKLRNGFINQCSIFDFNITAFRAALGQHQVNTGMLTDFDFPLDTVVAG